MVYVFKRLCLVMLFSLTLFTQSLQAQQQSGFVNQEAYNVVQSTTDALIAKITENREIYQQDTELFFTDVDTLLSTVIDFDRIARRVMAKYYKNANAAQLDEFRDTFKRSLLKVYAKALLDYKNEKIVILPPRETGTVNKNRQRVDIELFNANGQKFPITYSMYLDKKHQWKMENVIVNGVNIGLTYRNQFARLMKINQNDFDLVIAGWTSNVDSEQ